MAVASRHVSSTPSSSSSSSLTPGGPASSPSSQSIADALIVQQQAYLISKACSLSFSLPLLSSPSLVCLTNCCVVLCCCSEQGLLSPEALQEKQQHHKHSSHNTPSDQPSQQSQAAPGLSQLPASFPIPLVEEGPEDEEDMNEEDRLFAQQMEELEKKELLEAQAKRASDAAKFVYSEAAEDEEEEEEPNNENEEGKDSTAASSSSSSASSSSAAAASSSETQPMEVDEGEGEGEPTPSADSKQPAEKPKKVRVPPVHLVVAFTSSFLSSPLFLSSRSLAHPLTHSLSFVLCCVVVRAGCAHASAAAVVR